MSDVGRPLKFETPELLQEKIDEYFYNCDPHVEDVTEWVEARDSSGKLLKDENGLNYLVEVEHKVMTKQIPYTVTGLANWLGTSRNTLVQYGEKELFVNTIKAAKDRVEAYWELQLLGGNATGPIFNLKNNYGWADKSETDITTKGEKINPYSNLSEEELRKLAGK